ncbi:hypothetical protein N7495_004029 [Penicillium taxi]|uniref:uncharacterized protein n=1 Tax=Penicillium taxi TaxID=168475 RepID=UPI0025454F83|nr:uncharacterized protein N7495_004029 [Penicillium taxi]KAJ5899285.1 hypothetical protein N7495_004029 [Penicillium taxi]
MAETEIPAAPRKRGRPRTVTDDQEVPERRRKQLRVAQQAYRRRKETTINNLQTRVHELEAGIEDLSQSFLTFSNLLLGEDLLSSHPRVASALQKITQLCVALARQGCDDTDATPVEAEVDAEVEIDTDTQANTSTTPETETNLDFDAEIVRSDTSFNGQSLFPALTPSWEGLPPTPPYQEQAVLPFGIVLSASPFDSQTLNTTPTFSSITGSPGKGEGRSISHRLVRACCQNGYSLLVNSPDSTKIPEIFGAPLSTSERNRLISGFYIAMHDQVGDSIEPRTMVLSPLQTGKNAYSVDHFARTSRTWQLIIESKDSWLDANGVQRVLAEKGISTHGSMNSSPRLNYSNFNTSAFIKLLSITCVCVGAGPAFRRRDVEEAFDYATSDSSFGAHPTVVREVQRKYMDIADLRPDPYVRVHHAEILDESRKEVAKIINARKDECVFVKNATTGVATVLQNLNFQPDETVVYFQCVYGAVEKGIVSMQERNPLQARKVVFNFPIAKDELERLFRETVRQAREDGLKARAAVFDTIVSMPGVRFPFERFVEICRDEGILSVIDGAHGIGHIPLDMEELQPDFFTSNCHKWLYTPRSAAVLYVPKRNQHLLRTTLPTSWGYIPAPTSNTKTMASVMSDPNRPNSTTPFEELFQFVATTDDSAYLCVPAALKFRQEVCGGEEAIMAYTHRVANEGGDAVAAALGTEVLQEPDLKPGEESDMRKCALSTIRMPIGVSVDGAEVPGSSITLSVEEAARVAAWFQRMLMDEYDTFVCVFTHGPWLWVRISGQIYLEKSDFEWLGGVLRDLCEKVVKKEY